MFSMMFHSSQLISECNSLCRFWTIKFSVIWVLGLGKILRRAFDCLDHLWHLNVFSNWDKALSADSLHPWDMCYFISLVLRDFVLWLFRCFGFFFFWLDLLVLWRYRGKTWSTLLWRTRLLGVKCKGFASFSVWNFFCYCKIFFFACNCTSLNNLLFCFFFIFLLSVWEELGRMPLRWPLSTSQWFGSQVTNLEGNVPFYLFVACI